MWQAWLGTPRLTQILTIFGVEVSDTLNLKSVKDFQYKAMLYQLSLDYSLRDLSIAHRKIKNVIYWCIRQRGMFTKLCLLWSANETQSLATSTSSLLVVKRVGLLLIIWKNIGQGSSAIQKEAQSQSEALYTYVYIYMYGNAREAEFCSGLPRLGHAFHKGIFTSILRILAKYLESYSKLNNERAYESWVGIALWCNVKQPQIS